MADGKTVTIQHLSADQAGQTSEPGLPDYGAAQPSGGGFMDWIREHKLLVVVVLGGAGLLLLIWFYNQGQAASSDTSGTDSTDTGTSDGSTSGLGTSGYGAPDWSPVLNAITGLQQQETQDTQGIMSALQSSNVGTPATTGAPTSTLAQPTESVSGPSSPSWQAQPLGSTSGLSNKQEATKQYQGCVSNCEKTVTECKGKKAGSTGCKSWCQQKCAARHPIPSGGGFFKGGSSLSLRSMHMREPHWRSTDHQGIHIGRGM